MGKLTFFSVFGFLCFYVFLCFCVALAFGCEDDGFVTVKSDTLVDAEYDVQDVVADDAFPDTDQPDVPDAGSEWQTPCVVNLSDLTQEEVYTIVGREGEPGVFYLGFDGCGWCELYDKIFEAVCKKRIDQGVKFYKIDIFAVDVYFKRGAYPSTHFFFDGEEILYELGYMEEDELLWYIDRFLRDIGWTAAERSDFLDELVRKCPNCYCLIAE